MFTRDTDAATTESGSHPLARLQSPSPCELHRSAANRAPAAENQQPLSLLGAADAADGLPGREGREGDRRGLLRTRGEKEG